MQKNNDKLTAISEKSFAQQDFAKWMLNGFLLMLAGTGVAVTTTTQVHADSAGGQQDNATIVNSAATQLPQSVALSASGTTPASASVGSESTSVASGATTVASVAASSLTASSSASQSSTVQTVLTSADASEQASNDQSNSTTANNTVDNASPVTDSVSEPQTNATSAASKQTRMMATMQPVALADSTQVATAPSENAAIWMPDATLRAFAESEANHEFGVAVNDDNLSKYIGRIQFLTSPEDANLGIKSLAGLEYAQSLTDIQLYDSQLGSDGMVDLSHLPKFSWLAIFGDQTLTGTVDDFINQHLGADNDIWTIQLLNTSLSGTVPDLHNFPNLRTLVLSNDNLTGTIPDLSYVPHLLILELDHNQLTGGIEGLLNCPELDDIMVQSNDLSGQLPSLSTLDLNRFDFRSNHFTSSAVGLQPTVGWTYGTGQGVSAGSYKIGQGTTGFDPITGYLFGATDYANGAKPVADYHYTIGNWTTGKQGIYVYQENGTTFTDVSDAFSLTTDPDDPSGFKLVPTKALSDGTYMVYVTGSDATPATSGANGYSAFLYFNLVNVKPDEPDNPDQPDNPDNPDNPDQPDTPDNPDNPDQPDTSNTPDQPDTPQVPEQPSTPDQPKQPSEPAQPETTVTEVTHPNGDAPATETIEVNNISADTTSLNKQTDLHASTAKVMPATPIESTLPATHSTKSQTAPVKHAQALPETGEHGSTILATFGLALLSMLTSVSLLGGYRRRH